MVCTIQLEHKTVPFLKWMNLNIITMYFEHHQKKGNLFVPWFIEFLGFKSYVNISGMYYIHHRIPLFERKEYCWFGGFFFSNIFFVVVHTIVYSAVSSLDCINILITTNATYILRLWNCFFVHYKLLLRSYTIKIDVWLLTCLFNAFSVCDIAWDRYWDSVVGSWYTHNNFRN